MKSFLSGSHLHDAANRLLEDDAFTYTYDATGNRTSKTDKTTLAVTTYTYDVENQLVRVDLPGGGVVTYRYDALGRRIEKDVDGVITRYLYDHEDIVGLFSGPANCQTHSLLHGPGIDQPLAFFRDTTGDCNPFVGGLFREPIVDLLADGLGSQAAVTAEQDAFGITVSLAERYAYESFGRPTITGPGPDGVLDTGDDVLLTESALGNPYLFTGREYDPETGLYYYRARYYDSTTGVFLQTDPVAGIVSNPSTLHPYAYVQQNPVNFIDPDGRVPIAALIGAALIGGFSAWVGARLAGGTTSQVAIATGLGGIAGLGAAALAATALTGALVTAGTTSATSNIATQLANDPDLRRINITSLVAATGFSLLGAGAGFFLALGAASPIGAALASGLGAELPISLLGASVEYNLPPVTLESLGQSRFFKQQRSTCLLDRV